MQEEGATHTPRATLRREIHAAQEGLNGSDSLVSLGTVLWGGSRSGTLNLDLVEFFGGSTPDGVIAG